MNLKNLNCDEGKIIEKLWEKALKIDEGSKKKFLDCRNCGELNND